MLIGPYGNHIQLKRRARDAGPTSLKITIRASDVW